MSSSYYSGGVPGYTAERSSTERDVMSMLFVPDGVGRASVVISSTAADAGNSPTSTLRPGLLLGKITSTGEYAQYDADATDGTQVAECVLLEEVNLLDPATAANADKWWSVAISGRLKASSVINLDYQARSQLMARGFQFDDGVWAQLPYKGEIAKTADYTVTTADNGMLFTTTGASGTVIFTLPALAVGLRFRFFNTVNQTLTVASAAGDDMITDGDAAADSVTLSTSSHKIGGGFDIVANNAGTAWYVFNLGTPANVVTVAT